MPSQSHSQSSRACSKGSIKRKAYSYKKKSKKIVRVKSVCVLCEFQNQL